MLQLSEKTRQARTQLGARDDQVDGTVVKQELTALKTFRQFFTHRLLDHARPGKADQGLGLGDDDIAQHGQTCRYAAVNRVGKYGNERQSFFAHAGQHCGGLGHLHK